MGFSYWGGRMHQHHDPRFGPCFDPHCYSCSGHLYEPSFDELEEGEEEEFWSSDAEDEANSCSVCCRYGPRGPRRRSLGFRYIE